MNIFVLDKNPAVAATMLCDKHVVKMCLETAQILCSLFDENIAPYKRTHWNHPCVKWVKEHHGNFIWLVSHGLSLCSEYEYRYNKIHKSRDVINWCFKNVDKITFNNNDLYTMSDFKQAMPEQYKSDDVVKAYRNYYIGEKLRFAKWTKREQPEWILNVNRS